MTLAPGTSTGTSTVQNVTIGIPGLPVIKATAIKALSRTTCAGSSGSVTIANLTVGGVAVNTSVGPNTGISLGGAAKLILNEQTPVPGADKGPCQAGRHDASLSDRLIAASLWGSAWGSAP